MTAVVFDVNIYVAAVADRDVPPLPDDLVASWQSVAQNPGLSALAVVADGVRHRRFEAALYWSTHVLSNVLRVLRRQLGWEEVPAIEYVRLIRDLAAASGGGRVDVTSVVTDSEDHEDNAILALAMDASAELIVSNDTGLQHLSPWRGRPIIPADRFVLRALDAIRDRS